MFVPSTRPFPSRHRSHPSLARITPSRPSRPVAPPLPPAAAAAARGGGDNADADANPAPSAAPSSRSSSSCTLRVCTNRTCKRQGSEGILRFAVDLALPALDVSSCGCLGNCGAGPNVALLEQQRSGGGDPADDPAAIARHVATPAALVSLLKARWRPRDSPSSPSSRWPQPLSEQHLQAVQARLAGNAAAVEGQFAEALVLYEQALRLVGCGDEEQEDDGPPPPPSLGAHLVRSNMSAALLQMGRADEAAAEAERAERGAPKSFCTAVVRRVDALYALGKFQEAGQAAREGLKRHPSLSERPEWADVRRALAAKGVEVPRRAG